MQEYLDYIETKFPLILDTVQNYLNFGLSVNKIKEMFNDLDFEDSDDNKPSYPLDENDIYFHQCDDYWLELRLGQTFFNCPLIDSDFETLDLKFGSSKYYDPNTHKISEELKNMTFIEFLDDMGMRHDKSVEYYKHFNSNNELKPEEYFFKLLFLMHKFYSQIYTKCNYSYLELDNITDLIKWGRKHFRSMDYVDQYLIDDDYIKQLLLSNKSEQEISAELKDIYGIETYLTRILDGEYTGGLIGNKLNTLNISPKEKALYYLDFKNNKPIKKHDVVDLNNGAKMILINHDIYN